MSAAGSNPEHDVKKAKAPICRVLKCKEEVRPGDLMCKEHWEKVPLHLRLRMFNAYRKGNRRDHVAASREAFKKVGGSK